MEHTQAVAPREPWNKGKLVGQKAPLKLKDIWALRVRLQMASRVRELALFNLGIDSKLRGATSSSSRSAMSATATGSPPVQSSCSRKHSGRSSSRSRNLRATHFKLGSSRQPSSQTASSSLAVSTTRHTLERASTLGSWKGSTYRMSSIGRSVQPELPDP